MIKVLLKKEWIQLRVLRWIGFSLGALMPFFLVAWAEAASRGLTRSGRFSDYSTSDLFMDALPLLFSALWGLLALLICSQAFAGDRANGTEQFLLERPVRRSAIWRARFIAALASVLLLVLSHLLLWVALVKVAVEYSREQLLHSLATMGLFGGLVLLLSVSGATVAASIVNSPIQGVLLGMVFAIPPIALAWILGNGFPLAAVGPVPVGMLLPWLLPVGYLLASFIMLCRGEPAGGGRLKRGAWALGLSLLVIPLLFLITAPLAVRANVRLLGAGAVPVAADKGSSVCMVDYAWRASSGWIIDLERKRRLRFLAPPVWDVAWSGDGDTLAVLHSAGPLGSLRSAMMIDFFDRQGGKAAEGFQVGEAGEWLDDMRWDGDRIVARSGGGIEGSAIVVISPRAGKVDRMDLPENWWKWWLIGPTSDGDFFVYRLMDEGKKRYALHRLDLERVELDPESLIVEEGYPTYSGKWISPSGRFWLRNLGDAEAGMQLADLESGEEFPLPECHRALWVGADRLICLEESERSTVLTIGLPGEPREQLRAWAGGRLALELSPAGNRLMIQFWRPEAESEQDGGFWTVGALWRTRSRLLELWVFDLEREKFHDLSSLVDERKHSGPAAIRWAGPDTLALTGPGRMAFTDLDNGEGWHFIIGKP